MKSATLITGLVKTQVFRIDRACYYQLRELSMFQATDGEMLASPEMTITERVVPITQFCRPGRPDLYIAYTEEVEELLGVPIRILLKEKDEAISALHTLRSMTPWQHIKTAWEIWKTKIVRRVDSRNQEKP